MRNYTAKDVDGYIAGAAPEARPTLKELRKLITSAIPDVEEKISWGVPFYRYHGLLAGFSAYTNHVSFGLVVALQSEDRTKLEEKGYKTGKKTIQIKFGQKVPSAEIQQLLKAQASMNKAKER